MVSALFIILESWSVVSKLKAEDKAVVSSD